MPLPEMLLLLPLMLMLMLVAVVATKKAIASADVAADAVIAWRPRWCTSEQVATSERSQSFREVS